MKKILLSAILLFSSIFTFADEAQTIILKSTTTSITKRPRSVVIKPAVEVDTETMQLTISMVSDDSYTIYVYDGNGGVVYQGDVMTDGGRHIYFLPELEADLYSISIEGGAVDFEGEFYAN